jgi:lipopolysaccharide biosynthesis protein
MQETHIQAFIFCFAGNKIINESGTTAFIHQHGSSDFAMQSFFLPQKGQMYSSTIFNIVSI